jgi:hypothetical protein
MMDSIIWANPDLWRLWTWCLLKANHSDRVVLIPKGRGGNAEVQVNKDQFVFGRHSAARQLGWNPSTVWKRMKKLERLGFLNINSNNLCSVITIVNIEEMTNRAEKRNNYNDSNRKSKVKVSDTTNNDKNENNKKTSPPIVPQGGLNGLDEKFESFWKCYPRKQNKADAKKAFYQLFVKGKSRRYYHCQMTDDLMTEILQAVESQKFSRDWLKDDGQFIPHPASWLRGLRWQDETELAKPEDPDEETEISMALEDMPWLNFD